ncbi:hypothetical protein ABTN01_19210, partial [Acinetobacter baumannii]
ANSPNNPANYVVYDDKGKRLGWYARNTNGVLVYFNAEGKALPRPTSSGGGGEAESTATAAKPSESKESAPDAGGAEGERSGLSQQQK